MQSRRQNATMWDVARAAGVSQTTVSLVLSNAPNANISDDTRSRIHEAVAQLGYRPHAAAKRMRSKSSNYIGLIADEIATTPFAGKIIQGAQDAAVGCGKIPLLFNTGFNKQIERNGIEMMLEHMVDGIIYAAMYHHVVSPPPTLREVPAVLLNCYCEDRSLPSIASDEVGGGYRATAHLLAKGHRRIGFANFEAPTPGAQGRLVGYRQALADAGIPYEAGLVRFGAGDANGGYECTHHLFGQPVRPTALFCFNDRMAMGAYDALRELGLSIPRDVAVVGYDNQEIIAAYLRPGLTTLELPHYQMGRRAVDYLMQMTAAPAQEEKPPQILLDCPLVERESV